MNPAHYRPPEQTLGFIHSRRSRMTRSPFRRLVFGTLRRLLYLWVRSETINQSSLTLNLDLSRPVFYVLQNPSLTDLAVVDTECTKAGLPRPVLRSEEHTSELQSLRHLVCRLLLE